MRQNKKIVCFLLMAFFFVWTNAVLHLLHTPHEVCEHGKIVDVENKSKHTHHNSEDNSENKDNPNHEDCSVLAFITSARTIVNNDVPFTLVSNILENNSFVFINNISAFSSEELFYLAPSNSPPHS